LPAGSERRQPRAEGGPRGRGGSGGPGCKPHKVILQNVYAKRFSAVAKGKPGGRDGGTACMILFATISTRHHRGRTYIRAARPRPLRGLIEPRSTLSISPSSLVCRLLLDAVGVFLKRIWITDPSALIPMCTSEESRRRHPSWGVVVRLVRFEANYENPTGSSRRILLVEMENSLPFSSAVARVIVEDLRDLVVKSISEQSILSSSELKRHCLFKKYYRH